MAPDCESLSTARINRLLRPLRSRCMAFATFQGANTIRRPVRATYSQNPKHSSVPSEDPPLLILQPPERSLSRIHLEKHCVENLELSRKIYSVRDAFKDVVVKTEQKVSKGHRPGPAQHYYSLTAICANIVGNSMESEESPSDDEAEEEEEEEILDAVTSLYEAVPPQHRRWTLLSHALSIVLENCPRHPTLLRILLDVSLGYNLVHESTTVLEALLLVAFASPSGSQPLVCHPAHSDFLSDLRDTWISAGCSEQRFLAILCDVLVELGSPSAWSCRALHKLVGDISSRAEYSLISMMCRLVEQVSEVHGGVITSITAQVDARGPGPGSECLHPTAAMLKPLQTWLNACSASCFRLSMLMTSSDSLDSNRATLESMIEFLSVCRDSGVFTLDTFKQPHQEVRSAILSIATLLLPVLDSSSSRDVALVVELLRGAAPLTSAYKPLVTLIFSPTVDPKITIKDRKHGVLRYATCLRAHGLLRLEASLWACALHHIEHPRDLLVLHGSDQIKTYHKELIHLVDDAEKRCFGSSGADNRVVLEDSQKTPRRDRIPCSSAQWNWEPIVGSWVQASSSRTPARKRAKLYHAPARRASLRRLRPDNRPIAIESGTSSDASDDEENHCDGGTRPLAARRSLTNFTSILFDALSNRTVLHAKKQIGRNPSRVDGDRTQYTESRPKNSREDVLLPSLRDKMASSVDLVIPSSDDMNLFAMRSSSPAPS